MEDARCMACGSQGLHYANPRLPLNVKLAENLECGSKIYIYGAVEENADRFSMNLKDGQVNANTFFHFNPRFGDDNVVVRNSRFNEAWGSEERDGQSPFTPGERFLLLVQPTVEGFEVHVNGNLFTTFRHRDDMPLCNVTHLTLKGDIVCYGIHIPLPAVPIPLTLAIPGKTCKGDMFFISGDIPGGSDRFAINLQCGTDENADIMFHFNPRFDAGEIVCNSRCGDAWDQEERDNLPVGSGDRFQLVIGVSSEAYHTFLNGSTCVKFNHRLDVGSACTMVIGGDISISDLRIDCPPSKLPPRCADSVAVKVDEPFVGTFYPANPATLALPSPFEPGNVIILSGIIDADATRFKVNLQCGDGNDDDIHLHINPRWEDSAALILNNREGGEWGAEVRAENALVPGSRLELLVANKESGYSVCLNGSMLPEFEHRATSSSVTHVIVDGCLQVERFMALL